MEELQGKAALVTGASGGIGAAVARALHDAGARVALLSRRGDDLGLEGAHGVACDVRDRSSVNRAVAESVDALGGLDSVVANAGVGSYGPFLEMSAEDTDAMIDTNLKGVIHTAAATLPHLVDGGGDFVSVASVAGVNAFPNEAVYNASKFGQVGFVRALDMELTKQESAARTSAPGASTRSSPSAAGARTATPCSTR